VKKETLISILIFLLAVFLRFYKLRTVPPSLNWDEVAQGYNAFSILKTGFDEHQKAFPQAFLISFGDFKPPLYTYFIIPPMLLFGVNEFSVRFPSAFFGSFSVLLAYFLTRELIKDKKSNLSSIVSLISSFLLAISPWHIQLSRGAYEANLATFFTMAGILFLFKGVKRHWFWLVSVLFFIGSIYTFNTPRVFVLLLGFGFLIFYYQRLWQARKWLILPVLLFIILCLPLVPHLRSEEGRLRFKEVNIFSDIRPLELSNQRIEIDNDTYWSRIIHNRRLVYGQIFMKHLFDHFNPKFLFFTGDRNPRFSSQETGQLYLIELPLLILGILYLIKDKQKNTGFLIFWLFAALIPAATARETPHALRTEVVLPTYQIIISYGIYTFFKSLNSFLIKPGIFFLIIIYFFSSFRFFHNYFVHYPIEYSSEWQYGYKQMIDFVKEAQDEYDYIVVTRSLGRPYIYFLFYQQYSPSQFWQNKQEAIEPFGVRNILSFDKYKFEDKPETDLKGKVLYIMTKGETQLSNVNLLKTIYLLNGEVVFYIYTN